MPEQGEAELRWRLEAILTCKSFVRLGYRGERLIEPSELAMRDEPKAGLKTVVMEVEIR
ncbi:unnamed protein product [Bathycoccus prasinos]